MKINISTIAVLKNMQKDMAKAMSKDKRMFFCRLGEMGE
jgi:hypothetical protein